ncbi:MAG: DeoR/GlpR family DNA-binding transcription regulator [Actinobacteria bacterium]|nr:DeoR/GlpR family DNA-binding transcription regulator [Actinomycetota bacterium]
MARSLRHRKKISVVTNNMNVALELSQRKGISVLVAGGYLRGNRFSIVGPATLDTIRSIKVDKAFFGMSGIDPVRGFTAKNEDEAVVNRAMIGQAKMTVAIGDHSKFGTVARILVCPPEEVDLLITDTGADEAAVARFEEMGTRVWQV